MINDNLFLLTALKAPPKDDDEACERVAELGASSLTNLTCAVFMDLAQLQRALASCSYNMRHTVLLDSGRVVTHKATAIGPDGTEYAFILNEIAGWHCEVVNCKLARPGTAVDKDNLKAMKDVTG